MVDICWASHLSILYLNYFDMGVSDATSGRPTHLMKKRKVAHSPSPSLLHCSTVFTKELKAGKCASCRRTFPTTRHGQLVECARCVSLFSKCSPSILTTAMLLQLQLPDVLNMLENMQRLPTLRTTHTQAHGYAQPAGHTSYLPHPQSQCALQASCADVQHEHGTSGSAYCTCWAQAQGA